MLHSRRDVTQQTPRWIKQSHCRCPPASEHCQQVLSQHFRLRRVRNRELLQELELRLEQESPQALARPCETSPKSVFLTEFTLDEKLLLTA